VSTPPTIIATTPVPNDPDVVLGSAIILTFDQKIDTSTLNDATFSLTGPGQSGILTTAELLETDTKIDAAREYVTGAFTFAEITGGDAVERTVATFTPNKPLRSGAAYLVLVVGSGSILTAGAVKNLDGDAMGQSYQFGFTTGTLSLATPPSPALLPTELSHIDPATIEVRPRAVMGNDLTREIELLFPANIDPASITAADIGVSVEAILGDASVEIPPDLSSSVTIQGNKLIVRVTGWPA